MPLACNTIALLYHLSAVPVAERLATVGLDALQKFCGVVADGAKGAVLTVTVTLAQDVRLHPSYLAK